MPKHSMKSLLLIASLVGSYSAFAMDDSAEEFSSEGLNLTAENPITPYALKKNGKARKHFKIPYNVLVDYYKYSGQGTIEENTKDSPLMDLDMDVITEVSKNEVEFYFDMRRNKAYPLRLINPHSVSQLFTLKTGAHSTILLFRTLELT